MMTIADIYHDAKRFRSKTALDLARLALLNNYSEPHISIAAEIALERLN